MTAASGRRAQRAAGSVLALAGLSALLWAADPPQPASMPAGVESASAPDTTFERGRYLVQIANCASCHTAIGGAPFAGGKGFQTTYHFLGTLYSSNITPEADTGLGRWSEDDFMRAMRSGVAPGGRHLFPAFPYTAFTHLATDDLKAIYAYLKTLPAVRSTAPANSFWFRQRWVMVLWNALFFKAGEVQPDATQSEDWNRGRYLVEALGHCSACHTPRNLAMAERTDQYLTGGIELAEVAADKQRTWSAPNLTSVPSGLAKWSLQDLQKYLRSGSSRRAGTLGPMNEVIANSLRYLTDADSAAIAVYLKSLPGKRESARLTLTAQESAEGQALYDQHCDECHLSTGRGGFRKAPAVAGSLIVQADGPASLINIVLYGARPAEGLPSTLEAWEDMPGFADKLSDVQLARLADFLRSNWGNHGARVSPDVVAAQR